MFRPCEAERSQYITYECSTQSLSAVNLTLTFYIQTGYSWLEKMRTSIFVLVHEFLGVSSPYETGRQIDGPDSKPIRAAK